MQTGVGKRLLHLSALAGVEDMGFSTQQMFAGGGDFQTVIAVAVGRRGDTPRPPRDR